SPILEEDNAFKKLVTYQIAYILQNGIAEWSPDTDYQQFSVVRHESGFYIAYSPTPSGIPGVSSGWKRFYPDVEVMPNYHIPRVKVAEPVVTQVSYDGGIDYTDVGFVEVMSVTTMNFSGNYL